VLSQKQIGKFINQQYLFHGHIDNRDQGVIELLDREVLGFVVFLVFEDMQKELQLNICVGEV
jgi:hypothetical protein